MKLLITLFAAVLAVSALPTNIDQEKTEYIPVPSELSEEDAAAYNGTARVIPAGLMGFATMNGGTRGGNGGSAWTVWDAWALRDALNSDAARIVYVRGRIDLTALFTGSPGVSLRVGSWTTIMGGDSNALITGGGLSLNRVSQVIIHNLRIFNALNYAQGERPNGNGGIISMVPGAFSTIDNVEVRNSEHVWINHCEFADDPWNSASTPDNQRRHDGLIDIVAGANFVSVSNNIFRNHNMVTLVGNSDTNAAQDRGRLKVTFYNNWYQGTTQRNPRVRFGEVHVVNNFYSDIRSYAIGIGVAASVFVENNVFRNTRRAWGFAAGTPNPMGNLLANNNLLHSSTFDSGIPNAVHWRPNQYYWYGLRSVHQTEDYVRRNAGCL